MVGKDSIIFHFENFEDLEGLTDAEVGKIFLAMVSYTQTGEEPVFDDRFLQAVWKPIRRRLDSDAAYYEKKSTNGGKGGAPKKNKNAKKNDDKEETLVESVEPETTENNQNQPSAPNEEHKGTKNKPLTSTITSTITSTLTSTTTNTSTNTLTNTLESEKAVPDGTPPGKSKAKPPKEESHGYGEYGWIKLTDEQYSKLLNDLGQGELDRCIQYIDELAQSTNNKNKWRDWNLVVRRCHRESWGLRNDQSGNKKTSGNAYIDAINNRMNVADEWLAAYGGKQE